MGLTQFQLDKLQLGFMVMNQRREDEQRDASHGHRHSKSRASTRELAKQRQRDVENNRQYQ